MKPALEKFLLIAATLAAIGIFIYVALWTSIKDKKTQMDNLFDSTNVPTSYHYVVPPPQMKESEPSIRSVDGDAKLGIAPERLRGSTVHGLQAKDSALV